MSSASKCRQSGWRDECSSFIVFENAVDELLLLLLLVIANCYYTSMSVILRETFGGQGKPSHTYMHTYIMCTYIERKHRQYGVFWRKNVHLCGSSFIPSHGAEQK
jgi:hypothetical protein